MVAVYRQPDHKLIGFARDEKAADQLLRITTADVPAIRTSAHWLVREYRFARRMLYAMMRIPVDYDGRPVRG